MVQNNWLVVEVAYASEFKHWIIALKVPLATTIEQAIQLSGILRSVPEIDLTQQSVGIFSKLKALTDTVSDKDRIEIYRPLIIDPKEARRKRAQSSN